MRVIVDAMGGDRAPGEIVLGALAAHERYGYEIVLVGREAEIAACVPALPEGVSVRNATEVVAIEDDPATAWRHKKDSSLTVGLTMLKEGEGDAFVSAGSTGALLAGATLLVRRIPGVRRAALAPVLPTATGQMVLCDCGANAECGTDYLVQFAMLGRIYAEKMLGIKEPRVGLLNIGAEPTKGDTLRKETYAALTALAEEGQLRFVGNTEPSAALLGAVDVLVADGFSGNVMLKTVEGTAKFMSGRLKAMFRRSVGSKLAALLVRRGLSDFKAELDPNRVGGTAILGVTKPVVKAHGSSEREAVCQAIYQAAKTVLADVSGEMASCLSVGKEQKAIDSEPSPSYDEKNLSEGSEA